MDADAVTIVVQFLNREGVVKIFCVIGVDGKGEALAAIKAIFAIAGRDAIRDCLGLFEDGGGEVGVEFVFMEDALEFCVRCVGFAKDFDDVALGVEVALVPIYQLNDYFVSDFGLGLNAGITRIGYDEILNNARIIGNDVVSMPSFF